MSTLNFFFSVVKDNIRLTRVCHKQGAIYCNILIWYQTPVKIKRRSQSF